MAIVSGGWAKHRGEGGGAESCFTLGGGPIFCAADMADILPHMRPPMPDLSAQEAEAGMHGAGPMQARFNPYDYNGG